MSDRPLVSVDEALATVLAAVVPLPVERVSLRDARGRVLAQNIVAGLSLPPFANSAMDGYAVRSQDLPGHLRLVGESAAGRPFDGSVGPGQAVAISTGAALPEGADTVVMIERTALLDHGSTVEIEQTAPVHDNIRDAGSDIRGGSLVLGAGTPIGPAQIGAIAALGLAEVAVRVRPRVAVLPTGDELRSPGEPLRPGQIYNSNGPMLRALIEDAGALATEVAAVADTADAYRDALTTALGDDVVISSGGVSIGPHDLVRAVGHELGVRELFWRIAMKPGKPLCFGVRERTSSPAPTLVFGVPGNPVSTLVCFELFVRPALRALTGAMDPSPRFASGVLTSAVKCNPLREELIRVHRNPLDELEPLRGQQSHQISVSSQANALARIPIGEGVLAAGTRVAYLSLGAS